MNFRMRAAPISTTAIGHTSQTKPSHPRQPPVTARTALTLETVRPRRHRITATHVRGSFHAVERLQVDQSTSAASGQRGQRGHPRQPRLGPHARWHNDTEPHLLRFLTDKYRPGTVLSRSLLQQIRRNGPHLSPIDRFKIGRPRKKKHHPVRDWLLRFLAPRPADASLRNGIVPTARGAMLRRR